MRSLILLCLVSFSILSFAEPIMVLEGTVKSFDEKAVIIETPAGKTFKIDRQFAPKKLMSQQKTRLEIPITKWETAQVK